VIDGATLFGDADIRVENPGICKNTLLTGIGGPNKNEYPVTIFPNPFSNYFTVDLPKPGDQLIFELMDPVSSRNICSHELSGKRTTINPVKCPGGIYFYRILQGETILATGKLIRN
jgi:hypothetical protein